MKIILLQDMKNLGVAGDIKEVADGYAGNFLIPKKLAEPATREAAEKTAIKKRETEKLKNKEIEKLRNLAKELEGREIIIKAKEKGGKLFGSIGKKEIAEKLGNEISEDMIELKENIKEIGEKRINIDFGNDIKARIIINVVGE